MRPIPRVRDAQREHPVKTLRRPESGEKARPSAPVMTDPRRPLHSQRVEDGQQVRSQLLLLIARCWRLCPAVTPQVRRDHPEAFGEARNDVAPRPPILRPPVNEHDRWGILGAGEREVRAQPTGVDIVVPDADQLGRIAHGPRDRMRSAFTDGDTEHCPLTAKADAGRQIGPMPTPRPAGRAECQFAPRALLSRDCSRVARISEGLCVRRKPACGRSGACGESTRPASRWTRHGAACRRRVGPGLGERRR